MVSFFVISGPRRRWLASPAWSIPTCSSKSKPTPISRSEPTTDFTTKDTVGADIPEPRLACKEGTRTWGTRPRFFFLPSQLSFAASYNPPPEIPHDENDACSWVCHPCRAVSGGAGEGDHAPGDNASAEDVHGDSRRHSHRWQVGQPAPRPGDCHSRKSH